MPLPIHAITLDLDDTLWPVAPAIARAEAALDAWLATHAPRTARQWPRDVRRVLRDQVETEHPHLAHDFTAQRLITLERMLASSGEDTALVASAFEAYFAARCEVEHYDDSIQALERLAAHVPLAAVSNGNACLRRIGLMHLFQFQLGAREHGVAKPARSIFHAACAQLGCQPAHVLHVGDDVTLDVVGAAHAGLQICWINRRDAHGVVQEWPRRDLRPDLEFDTLAALADWLDASRSAYRQSAA
jgi:HAD superfamily hydrolase (TIGR01549 family)